MQFVAEVLINMRFDIMAFIGNHLLTQTYHAMSIKSLHNHITPLYKLMLADLDHIRNPTIVCMHTILHSKIVVVIGVV